MEDRFKFIRDTELKYVGTKRRQKYMFALFQCPYCKKEIETRKIIGLKQICCKKCYPKYRIGKHFAHKDRINISGYFYIQKPDHPNASKKGYIAEHRFIAEMKIGRYLLKDEIAHHVNGIKKDNRPENIKVMKRDEHTRFHKLNAKRSRNGQFEI